MGPALYPTYVPQRSDVNEGNFLFLSPSELLTAFLPLFFPIWNYAFLSLSNFADRVHHPFEKFPELSKRLLAVI